MCLRCNLGFWHAGALAHHFSTSSAHHICKDCIIDFPSRSNLVLHYQLSPVHSYCPRCDEHFATRADLSTHYEAFHNICLLCLISLVSITGYGMSHSVSDSDQPFTTQQDLREHYHRAHWACFECRQICGTAEAFDKHCRNIHWYCAECERVFKDGETLAKHLDTNSIHKGRTILCPGWECVGAFAYSSALIQHLESGRCRSRMDRHKVNRITVKLDAGNVITNPARLLGGPDGYFPPKIVSSWATEQSRSPATGRYECPVCSKAFRGLHNLQDHLDSPVHDVVIYRCPKAWQGCEAEFRTLSGLCQHVEGGVCEAGKFAGSIQKYVGSLADGMNRLAL